MKKVLSILCLLSLLNASCNKDDDEPTTPDPNAGDAFLTYVGVDNESFKMWVGGAEVPTDGLSIFDYLKSGAMHYFDPQILENGNVSFDGDSITVNIAIVPPGSVFLYRFSNDSLYITYPVVGDQFTAIGSKQSLKMSQGYVYASRAIGNFRQWKWKFDPLRFDFENSKDHHYWDAIADMNATDTLIIYNQDLNYGR